MIPRRRLLATTLLAAAAAGVPVRAAAQPGLPADPDGTIPAPLTARGGAGRLEPGFPIGHVAVSGAAGNVRFRTAAGWGPWQPVVAGCTARTDRPPPRCFRRGARSASSSIPAPAPTSPAGDQHHRRPPQDGRPARGADRPAAGRARPRPLPQPRRLGGRRVAAVRARRHRAVPDRVLPGADLHRAPHRHRQRRPHTGRDRPRDLRRAHRRPGLRRHRLPPARRPAGRRVRGPLVGSRPDPGVRAARRPPADVQRGTHVGGVQRRATSGSRCSATSPPRSPPRPPARRSSACSPGSARSPASTRRPACTT